MGIFLQIFAEGQMADFMKQFFTTRLTEKLLAALFTLFFLFVYVSQKEFPKVYNVKIEAIIAADQILVSDNVDFVMVNVRGTIFDFYKIDENDMTILFDFSKNEPAKWSEFLDVGKIPESLGKMKIESVHPNELFFETERKIQKRVPVEPSLEGSAISGLKMGGWEISPDAITVFGPQRQLENLETLHTEKIALDKLSQTAEMAAKVLLPKFVTAENSSRVKVVIKLEKDIKEQTFQNVKVVLDAKEAAKISPETIAVTLKAPKNLLDELGKKGFYVYVKDDPDKTIFKTSSFYLKDSPPEIQIESKKNLEITVNKSTE